MFYDSIPPALGGVVIFMLGTLFGRWIAKTSRAELLTALAAERKREVEERHAKQARSPRFPTVSKVRDEG